MKSAEMKFMKRTAKHVASFQNKRRYFIRT